jgi:hypothetical protein
MPPISLPGDIRWRGARSSPAGATGVAVGIGGRLVAVELFDAASTLAEQWPRLVEGAASAYADHRRAVAAGMLPKEAHRYPDEGALGRMLGWAAAAATSAARSSTTCTCRPRSPRR